MAYSDDCVSALTFNQHYYQPIPDETNLFDWLLWGNSKEIIVISDDVSFKNGLIVGMNINR